MFEEDLYTSLYINCCIYFRVIRNRGADKNRNYSRRLTYSSPHLADLKNSGGQGWGRFGVEKGYLKNITDKHREVYYPYKNTYCLQRPIQFL